MLSICLSILLCKKVSTKLSFWFLISDFILIYALFSHCFLWVWFDLKRSGFSHFVSLFLASILLFIICLWFVEDWEDKEQNKRKKLKKKKSIIAVTMVAIKGKLANNGVSFGLIVSLCRFSLPRYLKVSHEMHVSIPFVILTED